MTDIEFHNSFEKMRQLGGMKGQVGAIKYDNSKHFALELFIYAWDNKHSWASKTLSWVDSYIPKRFEGEI